MSVSLLECREYDFECLTKTLQKSIDNLGGIEKYIKKGAKVLLKPNLLMKSAPEKAVATNPLLVAALAKILVDYGADVTVADSPGGFYSEKILKSLYTACGYDIIPELSGARLNYNAEFSDVLYEIDGNMRPFTFINPFLECDVVVSVAKLKTHGFATYTGAAKNLFGLVPGTYKADYHLRYPDVDDFCDAIIDIDEAAKPVLSFIDGVVGMEGAGPSGGTPRKLGVLIASDNPHEADMVGAKIIGLDCDKVPTLKSAIRRKLCPNSLENINIIGNISDFAVSDFEQAVHGMGNWLNNPLLKGFSKRFGPKPVFNKKICVACGECMRHCPAKAIKIDKYPSVDMTKCIRCFCCQELCPKTAVKIKRIKWYLR